MYVCMQIYEYIHILMHIYICRRVLFTDGFSTKTFMLTGKIVSFYRGKYLNDISKAYK